MADDRLPSAALPQALAWVIGIVLGLQLTGVYARAADPFHRLSAREIRAQLIGKVVTDDAHWSQHFRPDGTLHTIVLAQRRQHVEDQRPCVLCVTLKTRKQGTTTECYEVWRWKDHIEYRENGVSVMTGFVRKEWR